MKHTLGPWRADWDDSGQWLIEPLGITGHGLRGDFSDCIESANARLIAAAPELLEVLRDAVQSCSCSFDQKGLSHRVDCFVPAAQALIAKVEGANA